MDDLPRSLRRVRDALIALGLPADVHRLADSTRTAPEAAAAVGCELGAIVKSLLMRGAETGEPVQRPDAAYVRETTGYAIGGIPPLGHPAPVRTVFDEDLLRFRDGMGGGRQPARGVSDRARSAGRRDRRPGHAARGGLSSFEPGGGPWPAAHAQGLTLFSER